jgi:hypothetical protein
VFLTEIVAQPRCGYFLPSNWLPDPREQLPFLPHHRTTRI